jgi:hypothetical protein
VHAIERHDVKITLNIRNLESATSHGVINKRFSTNAPVATRVHKTLYIRTLPRLNDLLLLWVRAQKLPVDQRVRPVKVLQTVTLLVLGQEL